MTNAILSHSSTVATFAAHENHFRLNACGLAKDACPQLPTSAAFAAMMSAQRYPHEFASRTIPLPALFRIPLAINDPRRPTQQELIDRDIGLFRGNIHFIQFQVVGHRAVEQ